MYEGLKGYDRNQNNISFSIGILNPCYFMYYSDGISQNYLLTHQYHFCFGIGRYEKTSLLVVP